MQDTLGARVSTKDVHTKIGVSQHSGDMRTGVSVVYKIPYRRARAWPSGWFSLSAECACEQRHLAYKGKWVRGKCGRLQNVCFLN